jgi:hypothetical protein
MNTRAARAIRGAVFAGIATITAAAAHTLGGGVAPSPLFCAVLFALAVPPATALASPRPAPWRAALAVGAGQVLFHAAFALVGDIGEGSTTAYAMLGHAHGATSTWTMDAAGVAGADMTLAHVLAAIVTIALVCRGESLLARIAAWVVRRAAVAVPAPSSSAVLRRVDALPTRPRARAVLPPGLGRRGPPAALPVPLAA